MAEIPAPTAAWQLTHEQIAEIRAAMTDPDATFKMLREDREGRVAAEAALAAERKLRSDIEADFDTLFGANFREAAHNVTGSGVSTVEGRLAQQVVKVVADVAIANDSLAAERQRREAIERLLDRGTRCRAVGEFDQWCDDVAAWRKAKGQPS